jgi:competence protein ComEA
MTMTRWIGLVLLAVWCGAGAAFGADDKPGKAGSKTEMRADSKSDAAEGKVNINAASRTDLMKLDGVGSGTAKKIIAYRQANGPFKRPQDLAKIEGVGKDVLEKNAGRITVK